MRYWLHKWHVKTNRSKELEINRKKQNSAINCLKPKGDSLVGNSALLKAPIRTKLVTSDRKGHLSEQKIIARLVELGFDVAVPICKCRYDLVIDDHTRLVRAQCKTARLLANGCLTIPSQGKMSRNGKYCSYRGQAEVFLIYYPGNDKVYQIPVNEVPAGYISLRMNPVRNNQLKGIRMAVNYEL